MPLANPRKDSVRFCKNVAAAGAYMADRRVLTGHLGTKTDRPGMPTPSALRTHGLQRRQVVCVAEKSVIHTSRGRAGGDGRRFIQTSLVVVADARPAVRASDADVVQQLCHGLGSCCRSAVGVHGELVMFNAVLAAALAEIRSDSTPLSVCASIQPTA